jgi:hypothetical protein
MGENVEQRRESEMSRNGKSGPEFWEGSVRVAEDLGMTVADVEALGFRVVLHWSGVPAVSERDAFALASRQAMVDRQREAERRRREAEREQRMAAEFAARVPRGVPAPQPGMSALEVMLAANEDERPPSAFIEMLDEELAAGKGA